MPDTQLILNGDLYKIEKSYVGMSEVYKALNIKTDQFVAIKTNKKTTQDSIDLIKNEAEILRICLESEINNVPRFIDLYEYDEKIYLIMEWIQGQTFEDILKQETKHDVDMVLDWVEKILLILVKLHDDSKKQKILHRDLSPKNIILAQSGEIFIIDFGTAKFSRTGNNNVNTAYCTYGWAPPEIMRGVYQENSELFSIGSLIISLLTGIKPSTTSHFYEAYASEKDSIREISDLIYKSTCDLGTNNRFQTAQEMLDYLQIICSNSFWDTFYKITAWFDTSGCWSNEINTFKNPHILPSQYKKYFDEIKAHLRGLTESLRKAANDLFNDRTSRDQFYQAVIDTLSNIINYILKNNHFDLRDPYSLAFKPETFIKDYHKFISNVLFLRARGFIYFHKYSQALDDLNTSAIFIDDIAMKKRIVKIIKSLEKIKSDMKEQEVLVEKPTEQPEKSLFWRIIDVYRYLLFSKDTKN